MGGGPKPNSNVPIVDVPKWLWRGGVRPNWDNVLKSVFFYFEGIPSKKENNGQNIPISLEMASGKKIRGQKRKHITNKISPKRENRTPELKQMFERIKARKEKEKDAARKKIDDEKKEERNVNLSLDKVNENENDSGITRENIDDDPSFGRLVCICTYR